MKPRNFQITGTINKDGRLAMYMGELNEFCAKHKGMRVIANFEIVPRGTSEALKAYYYKVVVPQFQKALLECGERKTLEDTETFLRSLSPVMIAETKTDKGWARTLRGIDEVSNAELVEHIDTLKQIAAEEYSLYIEDPRTI